MNNNKIQPKFIGYARVSTGNQKEEKTIEIQEKALKEYADKNNFDLVRIFKDDGVSGGLEDRPALMAMLEYLKVEEKQNIEGVIIYKLDRLARDVRIQENLIYDLQEKRSKKIISIKEPDLDNKDITRVLMRQMLGAISQYEKGLIVMRLNAGRMNKLKKGGFPGGGVAYGYEVRKHELYINQADAEIIRNIFYLKRYKKMSYNAIARKFNQENVKTARGGKWHPMTIRGMFKNGIYRGKITYDGVSVKNPRLTLINW